MARPVEDSQNSVVARLDYLLQRARVVKPTATIDPPLQVSELVPEDEPLFGSIEGEDEARKLAVESAAKSLFYANLVGSSHSCSCMSLIVLGVDPHRGACLCHNLESA
jgi:THO complex subunit 1